MVIKRNENYTSKHSENNFKSKTQRDINTTF